MKSTTLLSIFALGFLLLGCTASNDNYTDEKGGFSISFKGEPKTEESIQLLNFGKLDWKTAKLELENDPNTYYMVSYADIKTPNIHSDSIRLLSDLFLLTQGNYLKKIGPQGLVNHFFININKYPGREFKWVDKFSGNCFTQRIYLVKKRFYKLEVRYNIKNESNDEIEKFLNSFKLLATDQNKHPEPIAETPVKKFDVSFAGEPVKQTRQVYGPFGPQILVVEMYEPKSDQEDYKGDNHKNILYGIVYSCFPAEKMKNVTDEQKKEFIATNFKQNPVIVNGGTILSEKETKFKDQWCHDGRALLVREQVIVHLKTFFIGNYIYQMMVMTPKGYEENAGVNEFFDSFKLN